MTALLKPSDPFEEWPLPDFRPTRWMRFRWWLKQTLCGLWGHKMVQDGYYDSYSMDCDGWWECSRCGWRAE